MISNLIRMKSGSDWLFRGRSSRILPAPSVVCCQHGDSPRNLMASEFYFVAIKETTTFIITYVIGHSMKTVEHNNLAKLKSSGILGSGSTPHVFNAPWAFSALNRKMIEPCEKDGTPRLFHLEFTTRRNSYSTAAGLNFQIYGARPTYVTKLAVKEWFQIWRNQFKRAGISMKDLGPYGRVFKPSLLSTGTETGPGSGEWTYSDVIVTPPNTDTTGSIEARDLSDKYDIHICGDTSALEGSPNDETVKWSHVGMIHSWLLNRKKALGAEADDAGGTPTVEQVIEAISNNPLAAAKANSFSSRELIEETIEMQSENAPYEDIVNSTASSAFESQHDLTRLADIRAPGDTMVSTVVSAPCGLLSLEADTSHVTSIRLLGYEAM